MCTLPDALDARSIVSQVRAELLGDGRTLLLGSGAGQADLESWTCSSECGAWAPTGEIRRGENHSEHMFRTYIYFVKKTGGDIGGRREYFSAGKFLTIDPETLRFDFYCPLWTGLLIFNLLPPPSSLTASPGRWWWWPAGGSSLETPSM